MGIITSPMLPPPRLTFSIVTPSLCASVNPMRCKVTTWPATLALATLPTPVLITAPLIVTGLVKVTTI